MQLTELIAQAPWREAVTYRKTWPHEYVLVKKDGQRALFDAVCARICAGEGLTGRFFNITPTYLFIADYKYWCLPVCDQANPDSLGDDDEIVLNRARLYHDRRDFIIQPGDTGMPADYPVNPPHHNMPEPAYPGYGATGHGGP